jgi:glycosyltransferase involved in cell wall biosynthesis
LPISVLYIHHSGAFGGASRSLLEMIRAFPTGSVKPYLITQKGNVATIFKEEGIPVIDTLGISQFDNTRYGYYRKHRWFLLFREIFYGFFTLHSIVRARRQWKHIDVIHVNEITNILSFVISKLLFKKSIIVHCRSVQQDKTARLRYSFISLILRKYADHLVAIDKTVKQSLPKNLKISVVHNGFTMKSLGESEKSNHVNKVLNAPQGYLKVAMVGNLLAFKGVYEFIEAARICIQKKLKILFFLIGGNPGIKKSLRTAFLEAFYLFHNVELAAKTIIHKSNIDDFVHIVKFTKNIHEVYKNIDILCFPSHLNAVGRPVLEAALFKVPSIVAITNPLDDTIIDNETGICIKPKDTKALADAVEYFYSKPEEIKRMGELAYKLALKNFDIRENAKKILEIYQQHVQKI